MRTPEEFDEIRPYDPEELPAIFEELIADPEFRAAAEQVLPEVPYEEACNRLRRCRTNLEVQQTFFYPWIRLSFPSACWTMVSATQWKLP